MSNNTNTLFWVITGAVIILSVFLLINNSSSNTLNSIGNKISSLWSGESNNNPIEENDEDIELRNNSNKFTCGRNQILKDGIRVKVKSFMDNGDGSANIKWTLTNESNSHIIEKLLHFDIYDCADNSVIMLAALYIDDLEPNETWSAWTNGGVPKRDFQYYVNTYLVEWR